MPNLVFNDNGFRDQNTICRDVLILKEEVLLKNENKEDIANRISKDTNLNPKK